MRVTNLQTSLFLNTVPLGCSVVVRLWPDHRQFDLIFDSDKPPPGRTGDAAMALADSGSVLLITFSAASSRSPRRRRRIFKLARLRASSLPRPRCHRRHPPAAAQAGSSSCQCPSAGLRLVDLLAGTGAGGAAAPRQPQPQATALYRTLALQLPVALKNSRPSS